MIKYYVFNVMIGVISVDLDIGVIFVVDLIKVSSVVMIMNLVM